MTIAAILALAVVAFAASAYAYLVYSPKPQMPSLSTEVQHATMGDRERSYLAYVPARLPSGAALVIVLHGSARIFADRNGITTAPEIARMEPQSQTIRPRSKS
jgi:poly(3-hydroxybutyrate) depolymerase